MNRVKPGGVGLALAPRRVSRIAAFAFITALFGTGSRAAELEAATAQHLGFPDARLVVNGLAWFSEETPALVRLPNRLKQTFPPKVWGLSKAPTGGRIRFATDSLAIAIVAQGAKAAPSAATTAIASGGVDFYVDGVYAGSATPNLQGEIRHELIVGMTRKFRDITVYLPIGRTIAVKEFLLEPGATVRSPGAFALPKPLVYYGSSITQGFAASNPGVTYQALLGRWLNLDFVNLGFSGNGLGEAALAHAVAEIDAACFIVDYWANPSTEIYRETLPAFVDILRQKHPLVPIIVTGPYYNPSEERPGEAGRRQLEKRKVAREFVETRRRAGDLQLFHVDGLEMLSKDQAHGLVDGRHANSMGFYFCARGLEPHLRQVLGLPRAPQGR